MLPPATAQVLQNQGHVTEDDEGRRKNGALVEGHDQLVPLKLPYLVRDGLHLEERVAKRTDKLEYAELTNDCATQKTTHKCVFDLQGHSGQNETCNHLYIC